MSELTGDYLYGTGDEQVVFAAHYRLKEALQDLSVANLAKAPSNKFSYFNNLFDNFYQLWLK